VQKTKSIYILFSNVNFIKFKVLSLYYNVNPFTAVRFAGFFKFMGYNISALNAGISTFQTGTPTFIFFTFLVFLRFFYFLFFFIYKTNFIGSFISFDFYSTRIYFFKLLFFSLFWYNRFSKKKGGKKKKKIYV
jgi:hypothetical protein